MNGTESLLELDQAKTFDALFASPRERLTIHTLTLKTGLDTARVRACVLTSEWFRFDPDDNTARIA